MNSEITPHPYRWFLLLFTVAYFTMSFVVRFAWPPVITSAAPELGIQMTGAGAYMSAFFIGYIITQIPGGLLGDRFGSRYVFSAALLVEGLGMLGVSLSPDFSTGFIFRVITGLGGGMVFASCVRYITSLFPKNELGLAFGLLLMAPSGVGVIVSNLLMPTLLPAFGWRGAFQVISVCSFCMSALAFAIVRDKPARQTTTDFIKNALATLKQKNIILAGLSGMWLIFVTVGFINWGNAYCERLGFSRAEAASVMLAFGIGGVIGSPLGGWINSYLTRPKIGLILPYLAMSPFFLLFSHVEELGHIIAVAAVIGLIVGFANPFTAVLITLFAGKNNMGTAGGLTGSLFQIGALISPTLLGYSVDLTGNFSSAWTILACAPFIGVFFLLFLKDRR